MKYALVFCIAFSVWPRAALTDPLIDVAIRLAEKPETDLEEFMDHVTTSFLEPVVFDQYFGPEDVPEGLVDPLYWAVIFHTSVDGYKLIGRCNRIGRKSDLSLRTLRYRGMNSSKSFADLINPQVTLQGWWPDPMSAFADDAVARLDCSINSGQIVDANVAASAFGAAFSDVQVKGELPNLFGSGFFLIEANHGESNSIRRLDSALMGSNDNRGPQIMITSWLLTSISSDRN